MSILLKAMPIRNKRVESLKERCLQLKSRGTIPTLKVLLIGNNPASIIYTRNKKKFIENLGCECEIIHLAEDISEKSFRSELEAISTNPNVHGCFVQFPLPKQLNHLDVGQMIPAQKDVDGFHKNNLHQLMKGDRGEKSLLPCTPKGIISLISEYDIDIEGKNIVIIGRSMIVGKPMSMLFTNHNATVTLCHSGTRNIKEFTKTADIIVTAIGKEKFLTRDYLNTEKSNQILIDVGMNQDKDKKLCGDMDFQNIKDHCKAITPVPGGVGPMTILSLAENLLIATERIQGS